jgi:peptidoglycan/xylan/chitin deacetylase (PgdA/CDA1 family)
MDYLRKHVTVISLSDAVRGIMGEIQLPANATVITIDDGYRDTYEIAFPVLKEFRFPATLFAVTDFIEGRSWIWTDYMRFIVLAGSEGNKSFVWNDQSYDLGRMTLASNLHLADRVNSDLKEMNDCDRNDILATVSKQLSIDIPNEPPTEYSSVKMEQLREMDASGVHVESHTVTHPILTKITPFGLENELKNSKSYLENMLNRDVRYFCYPNGTVNEEVRMAVIKAGYTAAVTTELGFNSVHDDPFRLRRIGSHPPIESFAQYASGFVFVRQRTSGLITSGLIR